MRVGWERRADAGFILIRKIGDMTTAWGQILPEEKSDGDGFYYLLAVMLGALAGWVNIKVGDLLLTAMVVLAACMLLGILSPRKPWRWVLLVGVFVPVVEWLAYFFLSQKPGRAQIYESFLAFLPGIAGAFGGAMGRGLVDNLFSGKGAGQASIVRSRARSIPAIDSSVLRPTPRAYPRGCRWPVRNNHQKENGNLP